MEGGRKEGCGQGRYDPEGRLSPRKEWISKSERCLVSVECDEVWTQRLRAHTCT